MAESLSIRDDCAERLKVLADSTRLQVVRALMGGPRHVGDLAAQLGVEQSLLSHHLRVLREAGLVTGERDGKAVLYHLAPDIREAPDPQSLNLGCCRLSFDECC